MSELLRAAQDDEKGTVIPYPLVPVEPDYEAAWSAYCRQLDEDGNDESELGNELAVLKAVDAALGGVTDE